MLSDKEKRQFIRHPITVPLTVVPTESERVPSASGDISLGGLSFFWPKKLSRGNRLSISIPVKDKVFEVSAKVVYSAESKQRGQYRTGVCFMDLPSAFRAKLAEEILEIMEYRKTLSRQLGQDISEEESAKKWIETNANRFPHLINQDF